MSKYTTLPGGAKIQLAGYVEDKTCPRCEVRQLASNFINRLSIVDGRRLLSFNKVCITCEAPASTFPTDMRGIRLRDNLYNDDGTVAFWFERDKRGVFGPPRSLKDMTFRLLDSGVLCPQPKFFRKRGEERFIKQTGDIVKDSLRTFSRGDILRACEQQGWTCTICGVRFTSKSNIVGHHSNISHADGGATVFENCQAVHARCNSVKGRGRPLEWTKRRVKILNEQDETTLFDP